MRLSSKMRKEWAMKMLSLVVAVILALGMVGTAYGTEHKGKTFGKTGEITLTTKTKIGGVALKPGSYLVRHRVEGTSHRIHFSWLKGASNPLAPVQVVEWPVEVACRVEPMGAKASSTALFLSYDSGVPRITRIEIKGERVAHVF